MGSTVAPPGELDDTPLPLRRPAPLLRTPSLTERLLSRIPSFGSRHTKLDSSSASSSFNNDRWSEEAKASRKLKIKRIFKQGVAKIMRQRAEEMNAMTQLAAFYVQDAFAGRLQHGMAQMSKKPWHIFAAFRVHTSDWWLYFVFTCNVLHSLLVFLEHQATNSHSGDVWLSNRSLKALELAFVGVYAVEVLLKMCYMGLRGYLKKPWQCLLLVIVAVLAVDATGLVGVRFARPLRPAVLSLRTRSIRRFYAVVGGMLPGFLRVCLPVVFFMLLSSSYAAMAFGREKLDFEDPAAAGYAIWILMVCGDNYSNLVNEALSSNAMYIPFMVVVLLVGSIFLLSLLMGVTYDVFLEHTTKQVKNERLKELKGLNAAFATMDPKGTGKLSMIVWDHFLKHLKPNLTWQERAMHFEIASNFSDELDVLGFMELRQVLSYVFINTDKRAQRANKSRFGLPKRMSELLRAVCKSKWMPPPVYWNKFIAAVIMCDSFLLPYSIPHQGPALWVRRMSALCGGVLLLEQVFYVTLALDQGRFRWSSLKGLNDHAKVSAAAVILHGVVSVLLLSPLLSIVCWGRVHSMESPVGGGMFDAERAGFGECWEEVDYSGWMGVPDQEGGVCEEMGGCVEWWLSVAYTLRLVRCWRLVTLNSSLNAHVETFVAVLPVFAQTLCFALIIAYGFAIAAMDVFADKASFFENPTTAMQTMLQLFMGVDFSEVMEETVRETGSYALFFFAVYHVLGVLIVFNLLTAIVIQIYSEALNDKSRDTREEQRMADKQLQETLYEYNQKQSVLRLWGKSLTEGSKNIDISRSTRLLSGRNMRHVLGVGNENQRITEEEVEACQKYAKVDLVEALRQRERGGKSPHDFERSFYKQIKAEPGGVQCITFRDEEVIFGRGDIHHLCYFVHKGTVRRIDANGVIKVKEKGEMFGEEALVASMPAASSAIAEGPVECLAVDRDAFLKTFNTVENLGNIFLRLQRSGSLRKLDASDKPSHKRRSSTSNTTRKPSNSSLGTSTVLSEDCPRDDPDWQLQRSISVPSGRLISQTSMMRDNDQPKALKRSRHEGPSLLPSQQESIDEGRPIRATTAAVPVRISLTRAPLSRTGPHQSWAVRDPCSVQSGMAATQGLSNKHVFDIDVRGGGASINEKGVHVQPSAPQRMPLPSAAPSGRRDHAALLRVAGGSRLPLNLEEEDPTES